MSWLVRRKREQLLRKAPQGPLRRLLEEPWPDLSGDAGHARLLAVDIEATGLEPATSRIVSMAWVPIEAGRIQLSGAAHHFVQAPAHCLSEQSVFIHGIGHDRVGQGQPLEAVLQELFWVLPGRVLVAHHAGLDLRLLSRACQSAYGAALAWPCIDTLRLLRVQLERRQAPIRAESLRLAAARSHYGLPPYPAHDALWDAVAAAELWLAISAEWSGASAMALKRVARVEP